MTAHATILEFSRPGAAAENALAQMRALLGRSGVESRWAQMDARQRRAVCVTAEISPRLAGQPLVEFSNEEREQLRSAIVLLLGLGEIWGAGLDSSEWRRLGRQQGQQRPEAQEQHQREALLKEASVLDRKRSAAQQVAQQPG